MIKYEDDCVGGCGDTGFGCRGSFCPLRHVPHYYCDVCGFELSDDEAVNHDNLCDVCYKNYYEDDET